MRHAYFDSIDLVYMPTRAYTVLKHRGLTSIRQIALMSDDDLLRIDRIGPTYLRAIRAAVPAVDIPSVEEVPFPMTPHTP